MSSGIIPQAYARKLSIEQRLAPILTDFYACNKEKIAYISNKSCDTKYRKEAEDSQTLAYFYIENI